MKLIYYICLLFFIISCDQMALTYDNPMDFNAATHADAKQQIYGALLVKLPPSH